MGPIAVSSKIYGLSLQSLASAEVNFGTATVKALLLDSTYVPNQDLHRYRSSLSGEVTGTGYTTGGVTLSNKTVTYDGSTNTMSLGSDNPTWPGLTATFRYLVFYVSTGTSTTAALLSYVDFGADVVVGGTSFTYVIPAGGFFQLTAAA